MRAGYGKTEITPPLGVELAGYGYYLNRRAESIADPLFARAVFLEDREERFLIVSCDCLGLSARAVNRVETEMEKRGIPKEHILLLSIHTHTGPAIKYQEGCGNTDEGYTVWAEERILLSCLEAVQNAAEVKALRYSRGKTDPLCAVNRAFRENPIDDQARFFLIEREGAASITVASFACHAVCLGNVPVISADYPGRVCAELEKKGLLSIYLNGACGDMNPFPCASPDRPERLEKTALSIVRAFEAGAWETLPPTVFGVSFREQLRLQSLNEEEIHRIAEGIDDAKSGLPGGKRVAKAWEKKMLADGLQKKTEDFSVRCAVLGCVPVIALPFEAYTLTGFLIRQEINDPRALVLGCAGEIMGYLPTMDDYDRHAYESLEAFFLYGRMPTQRGEAERLGKEIGVRIYESINEKKPAP